MAKVEQDKDTGKFLAKYTEEQWAEAIDTYVLYGEQGIRGAGRAASELSGIPIESIKVKAKSLGIKIKDKKAMEKYRASLIESRRVYLRSKMVDLIEDTILRMGSEYKVPIKTVNRYESFGEDVTAVEQEEYVYDRPPAREFDKLASALEKLVNIFRLEAGEPNSPVIKVESAPQQTNNTISIMNFDGIADPEARNRALKSVSEKMLSQIQAPEEVIDAEAEEDD